LKLTNSHNLIDSTNRQTDTPLVITNEQVLQVLHWYALYTRPRFEKKVDSLLQEKGIEVYLPLQTVVRQWSDRKKKVDEPLFRSYVFVHVTAMARSRSLWVDGVIKLVGFGGKPSIIPDDQIEALKRFLKEGTILEPCDYLVAGDWVEVTHGPFQGIKGRLLEKRSLRRFVISIDAIRQSLAVEIDPALLHKIEPPAAEED